MPNNDTGTISPDMLKQVLEILRGHFSSEDININAESIVFLTDQRRRNVALRIPLQSTSDLIPKSIILKQSKPEESDVDDCEAYSRFSRDWTGLEFANRIQKDGAHNVPRFYGGDKTHRFILLEDLGQKHISLVDALTLPGHDKAAAALHRYIRALAGLHAASFGHTNDYNIMLQNINEGAATAQNDLAADINYLLPKLESTCQTLGLSVTKEFIAEAQQVLQDMFEPGPFTVLIHGDAAPDNVFDHGESKELQLIDFEWAFPRNALLDGVFLRMSIPTGWCAKETPNELIESLDLIYRKELAKTIPAASDDRAFFTAYTQACAYYALREMVHVVHILKEDRSRGAPPSMPEGSLWDPETNLMRPRFLSRVQAFIDVATKHDLLPQTRQLAENMLAEVKKLWPEDTKPLDVYPAFQQPVLGLGSAAVATGIFSEKKLKENPAADPNSAPAPFEKK